LRLGDPKKKVKMTTINVNNVDEISDKNKQKSL